MFLEGGQEHFGQGPDAGLVVRVSDVDDPPIAEAAFVLDDSIQALDAVGTSVKHRFC